MVTKPSTIAIIVAGIILLAPVNAAAMQKVPGTAADPAAEVIEGSASTPLVTGTLSEKVIKECTTINQSGQYTLANDVRNGTNGSCIQIWTSDVVLLGDNHAVDSEDGNGSVGILVEPGPTNDATTLNNVTIRDVSVTGWETGITYRNISSGRIESVNASQNEVGIQFTHSSDILLRDSSTVGNGNVGLVLFETEEVTVEGTEVSTNEYAGFYLNGSSDNRFESVTARSNGNWSFFSFGNSTNNTGTNFTFGSTTMSFNGSNVLLTVADSPPDVPEGYANVSQFITVIGDENGSFLQVAIDYSEKDLGDLDESTLGIWQFEDGEWSPVNESDDVTREAESVSANVTESGVVAVLGQTETDGQSALEPRKVEATIADVEAVLIGTHYLDCNGNYEDILGDGRPSVADVVVFALVMVAHQPDVIQFDDGAVDAFDFDGDGRLRADDVTALADEVLSET